MPETLDDHRATERRAGRNPGTCTTGTKPTNKITYDAAGERDLQSLREAGKKIQHHFGAIHGSAGALLAAPQSPRRADA